LTIFSLLIGGVAAALRRISLKRLSLSVFALQDAAMTDSPDLPAVDPAINQAAAIYRAFMEEIKTRLTAIQFSVDGMRARPKEPLGFIQAESAILQLRNVCELMALSALAAHQPFGLADELLDSWNARLGFRDLAKLNARCFPRPIKSITVQPEGHKHIDDSPEGLPTLRGLIKCYLKCGSLLHRGIVRHAFEGTQKLYDIDWLDDWAVRIGELLVRHTMVIPEHGLALLIDFYGDKDDQVLVQIALADGPAVFVEPA
jgi:hypothetical protein